MQFPFFSIILLIRQMRHLLSTTLDTLQAQTEKGFEVILLDGQGEMGRLKELIAHYPELVFQLRDATGQTLSMMMNEGVQCAKGTYLQFLSPGDRFLSQQGLSYLHALLQEQGQPHLASSSFLLREPDGPAQAVTCSFNQKALQRGTFSPLSRTTWFLKEAVVEMGGFNTAFSYRCSFDFLCRLLQRPGVRAICSRRVLIDGDPKRVFSREVWGYAFETCQILYRHFGFWSTVRWFFGQNHLSFMKRTFAYLKQVFRKTED